MSFASDLPIQNFIRDFSQAAQSQGWSVEVERPIGGFIPDLTVEGPRGGTVVVDVQTGEGSVHFGTIAQLSSARAAIEAVEPLPVGVVLLTSDLVAEAVSGAAHELGVAVVNVDFEIEHLGRALVRRLLTDEFGMLDDVKQEFGPVDRDDESKDERA